jgi:hypothetical protein
VAQGLSTKFEDQLVVKLEANSDGQGFFNLQEVASSQARNSASFPLGNKWFRSVFGEEGFAWSFNFFGKCKEPIAFFLFSFRVLHVKARNWILIFSGS